MSSKQQSTHPRKKRSVGSIRNRSKVTLDVDLNAYPDGSSSAVGVSAEASGTAMSRPAPAAAHACRSSVQQERLPIDVDAIDDDVVLLSSPRRISQVPNRSKRPTPVMVFLDDDSDTHHISSGSAMNEQSKRLNLNAIASSNKNMPIGTRCSMFTNHDISEDVGSGHNAKRKKVASESERQETKPKAPTFTCAVCWGEIVDETSTKCGHIFCQECIKNAIKVQKKCPTCRMTLNMKNIHRVYLPTAN